MEEIAKRVIRLRKTLNLSQKGLGDAIGLSNSGISNIENGIRNVTDQHIKLLVSTFNVNEHWLRTGEGEMFEKNDDTIISELVKEYQLDDLEKKILEHYLQLNEADREVIKNYMLSLAKNLTEQPETAATTEPTPEEDSDDEIEAELKIYRQELVAEKRGKTSLALQKQG